MRRLFPIILLLVIFALVSCGPAPNRPPEQREYFEGYDGVEMEFLDRDTPPDRIYYYSDEQENSFQVAVEMHNEGSSIAYGGVYLSGYDPKLIHFRDIDPLVQGIGSCGINIGNILRGDYAIEVFCGRDRISGGLGQDNAWFVDVEALDIGELIDKLAGEQDWHPLLDGLDVDCSMSGENKKCNIGSGRLNLEYGSRGKLLIALLSGIDFSRNFGKKYLLEGDTPDYPGGDIALVNWDANILHFPPGLDETRQSFLVTNCYMYTTHAAPVVCIDPAPFSEGEKVCRPARWNPQRGQGAPVAITNIEQENTPREAIFTIHVQNRGDGVVWDPGMIEKCSPYQQNRVTASDKNKVYLGQVRISGDPTRLDCIPDDFIRLDRNTERGYITCRYDIPFQGLKSAYQTPLVVELWYGYENTIRKDVLIKRVV